MRSSTGSVRRNSSWWATSRDRNLGLALIRDGHGSRAFDTLLRYRGSALAELWRALRLLKALQAEAAHAPEVHEAAPLIVLPAADAQAATAGEKPIEPEARGILAKSRRRRPTNPRSTDVTPLLPAPLRQSTGQSRATVGRRATAHRTARSQSNPTAAEISAKRRLRLRRGTFRAGARPSMADPPIRKRASGQCNASV
jgi:hypothetical protein